MASEHGSFDAWIWGFIGGMQPPLTTDEQLAQNLEERNRTRERERRLERTR